MTSSTILRAIGNTPIVELTRVVPKNCARVLAKIEWANPTGSMKDRMALSIIDGAIAKGKLTHDGTVVEYTAGTTGISLALVCAARGYKLAIVTSDAFSMEKRRMMRALGADVTEVPSDQGKINEKLIKKIIETSRVISEKPGHWWCDQLNNHDGITGYHALGDEVWSQTNGHVDAFVQSVGTAHSIHGVAESIRKHKGDLHVVAVEPAESAVLSGGPSGSHKIEGIGIGFIPPLWKREEVDEIIPVSTHDAMEMARRLAREEALFAGASSGANVVAAIQVAQKLGPNATVVTLMVDSGLRYLTTELYASM